MFRALVLVLGGLLAAHPACAADAGSHAAWLGVSIADNTASEADALPGPFPAARVVAVAPGSAAEAAGLDAGDVITHFNGVVISDARALLEQVRASPPGSRFTLIAWRRGDQLVLSGTLGRREGKQPCAAR
jgi:S1-C subfamily serine protease